MNYERRFDLNMMYPSKGCDFVNNSDVLYHLFFFDIYQSQ